MNKQQLAAKIWASANKMRSKIEANEYKDYILGFIFYKFLSDNEVRHLKEVAYWSDDEIESDLNESDAEAVRYCQDNLGYFISYDNLFSTWLGLGVDFSVSNVTDALNAFPTNISNEENKRRVFKNIFKTLSDGITKLGGTPADRTKAITKLIRLIKDIPTDGSQDYDVLGFIYEYLIENFAANAGKKAGEFYTPHEVSLLMAEIVADHLKDRDHIDIYDPTSGSGSLLINIGHAVAKYMKDKSQVKYYAQELKENTFNLTRMNLVMRGIDADNILVRCGDTLEDDWPFFKESEDGKIIEGTYNKQTVDAVVSNPPYSQSWDPTGKKEDQRFKHYGVAPRGKADYAFLLHDLCHINDDGIVTIVLPHGVLFRPGDDYNIRKNLIDNNNIDAIIGLPADIFYGTGIATLVMVLKRHRPTTDVLIIDASKLSVKEGKKNKLTASDIRRIADTVINRTEISKFSRKVNRDTIIENDYNLNIPRYVDSTVDTIAEDVDGHLFGGIPESNIANLTVLNSSVPEIIKNTFSTLRPGYLKMECAPADFEKQVINSETVTLKSDKLKKEIDEYIEKYWNEIKEISQSDGSEAIAKIKDDMLNEIKAILSAYSFVDIYEGYQVVADIWKDSLSHDAGIIGEKGFYEAGRTRVPNMVTKGSGDKKHEEQDGFIGAIVPNELIERILFKEELEEINRIETKIAELDSEIAEITDFAGDESNEDYSCFAECFKDSGDELDRKKVKDAIKSADKGSQERKLLETCEKLFAEKAEKSKIQKQKEKELKEAVQERILLLTNEEIDTIMHEKWFGDVEEEMTRLIVLPLANEIEIVKDLYDRYSDTLDDIENQISALTQQIEDFQKELVIVNE